MRGWRILAVAVLVAIALGIGVEAMLAPSVYRLGGHQFSAVFPSTPTPDPQPNDPWVLTAHGLVVPPLFLVTLTLVLGSDEAVFPPQPGPNGLRFAARAGSPTSGALPATLDGGEASLELGSVGGFTRHVSIEALRGYYFGTEFAERGRVLWAASATAPTYRQVRNFLASFTPIS